MEHKPLTLTVQIPNTSHGLFKDEDAPPISEKYFFAIADGVGGSGAGKIKLPAFDSIEQLLKLFFGRHSQKDQLIQHESMIRYATRCFETVVLEKIKEKSSAYLGSRFLMMHLLGYYLLKEAEILRLFQQGMTDAIALKIGDEVTSYVKENIPFSALQFGFNHLPKSSFDLKILPTTLAGGFIVETEQEVHMISLWAGDSKGFMFKNNRIHMVTKDHYAVSSDGDDSADMTNSIRCLVSPKGEVRSDKYFIESKYIKEQKPLTVAYISDGLFSPLETHGDVRIAQELPHNFYHLLTTANTIEEYQKNIDEFYRDAKNIYTSDDRTVSWVAYGFENFEAFKKHYLVDHRVQEHLLSLRDITLKVSDEKSTRERANSTLRGEMVRALPEVMKLLSNEKYFLNADYLNNYPGFAKIFNLYSQEKLMREKEKMVLESAIKNQHRNVIELVFKTHEWKNIPDKAIKEVFQAADQITKEFQSLQAKIQQIEKTIDNHSHVLQQRLTLQIEKITHYDEKVKKLIEQPKSPKFFEEIERILKDKNRALELIKTLILFIKFKDETQLDNMKPEAALYKDAVMMLKSKQSLESLKSQHDVTGRMVKNAFVPLYGTFSNHFIEIIYASSSQFPLTIQQFEPLNKYFSLTSMIFPKRQIELAVNEHALQMFHDSNQGENPLLQDLPQDKITALLNKFKQTTANLLTEEERQQITVLLNEFFVFFKS